MTCSAFPSFLCVLASLVGHQASAAVYLHFWVAENTKSNPRLQSLGIPFQLLLYFRRTPDMLLFFADCRAPELQGGLHCRYQLCAPRGGNAQRRMERMAAPETTTTMEHILQTDDRIEARRMLEVK